MTNAHRRAPRTKGVSAAIIRVAAYVLLDLARLNLAPALQVRRPARHSATPGRPTPWRMPSPPAAQRTPTPAVQHPLAHVIHDYPLQDIYAALYLLEAETHHSAACLQQVRATLSHAAAQLRGLCSGLDPAGESDACLVSGLQNLVDVYTTPQQAPAITLVLEGVPPPVGSATADLLAIARGALVNALRHSQAATIWLKLMAGDAGLTLEIGDDGIGFAAPAEPDAFLATQRYGLAHMAARAALIGATLTLESAPGQGTRVRIALPPTSGDVWSAHPEQRPARSGGFGRYSSEQNA